MIKQAPSPARIAAMIVFAFSCIGILLYLWLTFGGSIPLQPKGYRVQAAFPEAIGLMKDVDVRASGVTIGTVRGTDLDKSSGRVLATLEIEDEFAPLPSNARAILRRKTLIGETFVEISRGDPRARPLREGERLRDSQIEPEVELDEIIQTYDPETRRAFRVWMQQLGAAIEERGEPLNDAVGQLPAFAHSAGDLLDVLNDHERALQGLVRDTGHVYGALTRDEAQLRNLVENSHELFDQTSSKREALAETISIFPTFLSESRQTLQRLQSFSRDAYPLMRDLRPVARELRPAVASAKSLAPHLERYFDGFGEQIKVSERSSPALTEILDDTPPLLRAVGPFLAEFNPIFQWLEQHQLLTSDFLGNAASATADTVEGVPEGEVGHYLRQLGVTGVESLLIHRNRLSSNRGNAYLPPVYTGRELSKRKIQPNWDCKPSGGEVEARYSSTPGQSRVACWVREAFEFQGETEKFHDVEKASYDR